MAPSGQTHIDITLAVLTTVGGVIGYVKKKSVPSLIGGCVFGLSYAATAYLIQSKDAVVGHQTGTFVSLAMAGLMGSRFVRTRKFMPAGLLALGGAAGTAYHYNQWREWTR